MGKLSRSARRKASKKVAPSAASVRPGKRGLNMKIAADGSMHIRHMSEDFTGLAIMPPVEIRLED